MCAAYNISISRECAHLVFVVLVFFASASYSSKFSSSLTVPGSKSSYNDELTSSRHKRAPGWGKRAPGWGKRQSLNEELFDDFDSDISDRAALYRQNAYISDDSTSNGWGKRAPGWGKRFASEGSYTNNLATYLDELSPRWLRHGEQTHELTDMEKRAPGWGKRAPGWGKRAPGWGKRAPGWGKRAPGWGKRAPGWGKRAPGWGKRNFQNDLDSAGKESDAVYEDNKNIIDEELLEDLERTQEITNENAALRSRDILSIEKRAQGWGKRHQGWDKSLLIELNRDDVLLGKRAPGWGKRAPGWGKRAPGWGKRAPGWGKREYEADLDDMDGDKRAPGWGKRASPRVKRSSSHTTHPEHDTCHEIHNSEDDFLARVKQLAAQRSFRGGNMNVANKPSNE